VPGASGHLLGILTACLLAGALPIRAPAWESMDIDLPSGAKESLWRDALAQRNGGRTEFKLQTGRADIVTSNEVFEVDWVRKWKEGMGQALAYAGESNRKPVLVLLSYSQGAARLTPKSRATLDLAEKECGRHGVRLLVLFPTRPEELPHTQTGRKPTAATNPPIKKE